MRAHMITYPLFLAAVLSLVAPAAFAQSPPVSLKAAVDAAWLRSPQGRTLEARRDEVAAGRGAAQSWIAGSPALGLSDRSDRWTDRTGVRERELSLSAPVWLPSQVSARRAQAEANADDLEAQIANARLALAGEVRERLWLVAAAKETLAEASNRQGYLKDTAEEVMRRVRVGDLARSDGLLAQQEALAATSAVVDAQLKLREALLRFSTLTGLTDIPAAEPEQISTNLPDVHPRLLSARTAIKSAQATVNVVSKTRSEPPTFGVAVRRERDTVTGDAASSVAVAVQVPIGIAARYRSLEAAARTQYRTATAEAALSEATLEADVALARGQVAASEEALVVATSRAALAREHAQLIEKAFRLGERGLVDMLRAQSVLHEAEVAARQQRVAVGLAHARLNQALGVAP